MAAVLRSIQNLHKSPYRLPLTSQQITSGKTLLQALTTPEPSIQVVHDLAFLLFTSTGNDRDGVWTDPLTCFIAVDSLRDDGSFIGPNLLATHLSVWTYNIKAIMLYHIVQEKDKYADKAIGSVLCFECINNLYLHV